MACKEKSIDHINVGSILLIDLGHKNIDLHWCKLLSKVNALDAFIQPAYDCVVSLVETSTKLSIFLDVGEHYRIKEAE